MHPSRICDSLSRRGLLKSGAALAAGALASRAIHSRAEPALPPYPRSSLSRFAYADVQLLDGPMLEQFRYNHALFLALDNDRLLKPFRQLAGLPAPGEDMGGWYSPSPAFDPPRNMIGYIPSHSFGQYLSGLARAAAVTGDPATKAKVAALVQGFGAAVSTKFYDGYCLPAYTFEKTCCGLVDARRFAEDRRALAVLNQATDAVLPWLPPKALNRTEMAARPHPNIAYTWDESYTLPENFYRAWQAGAGDRYRLLARRFLEDDTYFGPLAAGRNVLPGEHAYSHLNALCSAMQAWVCDGSAMHLRAAKNGFQYVLDQSFATGGWGPNETFCTPGSEQLADSLDRTHSSFETPCGAYGQFKIASYLMCATGESRYGDSMETVLYNTILGARPIQPDGTSFYYSDYNMDATKQDSNQKWPCCSGTFPQLTADYGISSYYRGDRGLYVNLYVPSRVSWTEGGAGITLTQQTSYPANGETALTLAMDRPRQFTVALRIPAWAGAGTLVRLNGRALPMPLAPGRWAEIDRGWKSGDRVELSLGMPLRLLPIDPQHAQLVALMDGPTALFAIAPDRVAVTREELLAAERIGSSGDWMVRRAAGPAMTLRPYPAIRDEHYRLYHAT